VDFREQPVRTMLWRYHLGGGCVLALAYVYLPYPPLRVGALVVLCLATIVATLASIRLWRPARPRPFQLFAAGRRSGSWPGPSGRRRP
jgi:hypothetical protein